jgi:hypothetical protein
VFTAATLTNALIRQLVKTKMELPVRGPGRPGRNAAGLVMFVRLPVYFGSIPR